jgi:hypothetical protein
MRRMASAEPSGSPLIAGGAARNVIAKLSAQDGLWISPREHLFGEPDAFAHAEVQLRSRLEGPESPDPLDQRDLSLANAGQSELRFRNTTGELQAHCILVIANDLPRQLVDLFGHTFVRVNTQTQPVPVGITAGTLFTCTRAGPGALARVEPIGGDLSLAHHD